MTNFLDAGAFCLTFCLFMNLACLSNHSTDAVRKLWAQVPFFDIWKMPGIGAEGKEAYKGVAKNA